MTNKDLKLLMDLANKKLNENVSKEEALESLMNSGILDINGNYTKPYKILEMKKKFDQL